MLMVAIGAARGILHAKTEGTDINGIFIPLLDPESTLTEDLIIDLMDDEFTDSKKSTEKTKSK